MRITVKQAAEKLECQERIVQGMIRAGFLGAYIRGEGNQRGTYYMTDEQVDRFKKGEGQEDGKKSLQRLQKPDIALSQ